MKLFNVSMLQNIHSITFYSSLKCVGFLIDKFCIQTVPGTKQHRFIFKLTILLHSWFFRHKKRLRSLEHLQGRETVYLKLYFRCLIKVLFRRLLCIYCMKPYRKKKINVFTGFQEVAYLIHTQRAWQHVTSFRSLRVRNYFIFYFCFPAWTFW